MTRARLPVVLAAVVLLGAGLYLPASGFPAFEGESARLEALGTASPAEVLAYQENPDEVRPLANLAAQALVRVSGGARSIRVASAALHGLTAVGIFLIVMVLSAAGRAPVAATLIAPASGAILFAVHPLASEAVIAHGAFPAVLGTALAVLAILLAAREAAEERPPRPFAPAALFLAALLCHAPLWPLGFVAAALDRRDGGGQEGSRARSYGRALGPYALALVLYYVCWVARVWPGLRLLPMHRPWSILGGVASQAVAFVTELRLLLAPWGLSVEHGDPAYLGAWNLRATVGAILLAALLAAGTAAIRKGTLARVAVGSFALLHVHFLIFPSEFPLEERRLYACVVAAALAAAAGVRLLEERSGAKAALAAAALVAVPLLFLTAGRIRLWEDPVALWESAAAASPSSARPHVALANLFLERGDTDRALRYFEDAVVRAPANAAVQNSLAEVYLLKGDYARSAQEASKAMEIDGRYLPAYITAGNSFMMRDRAREAFLAFNAALRVDPENPSALYSMGALLFQQKRYENAAEFLEMAAEKRPKDPEILFRLGMALLNTGHLARAAEALRGCAAIEPSRLDAKVNLASILTTLGHMEEARQVLDGVLEQEPGNGKALNGLGVLFSAQERWEDARVSFERAAAADPNDHRILYNLAGAYERLGERGKAIETYRNLVAMRLSGLEVSEAARARLASLESGASP